MLTRWGAKISSQTMTDWVRLAAEWLQPLYKRMQHDLLASGYVQVDETPVRCNDPDLRDGKTTQGWLWVISRPGGDVVFDWRLSRREDKLTSLLDGYRGILQSDAYSAYPAFVSANEDVAWVGCWAHARRKFFDALGDSPKAAQWVLRLIGRLYALESQWDKQDVGAKRATLRTKHFVRPLYWLQRMAVRMQTNALPKSALGQACTYLLNQWSSLTAHLQYSQTRRKRPSEDRLGGG